MPWQINCRSFSPHSQDSVLPLSSLHICDLLLVTTNQTHMLITSTLEKNLSRYSLHRISTNLPADPMNLLFNSVHDLTATMNWGNSNLIISNVPETREFTIYCYYDRFNHLTPSVTLSHRPYMIILKCLYIYTLSTSIYLLNQLKQPQVNFLFYTHLTFFERNILSHTKYFSRTLEVWDSPLAFLDKIQSQAECLINDLAVTSATVLLMSIIKKPLFPYSTVNYQVKIARWLLSYNTENPDVLLATP